MRPNPPIAPPDQTLRLSSGGDLAFRTAGDPSKPALVLLHGFPSSSAMFRGVMEPLSEHAFVVAPDLPGSGASDVPPEPTFPALADAVEALLDRLEVTDRFLYLHDFGAPVGLELAMRAPERVKGLIVQNANAHRSGMGPTWGPTYAFWAHPNPETEAAATVHMTLKSFEEQYTDGVPEEHVGRVDPAVWRDDWRVISLPGRMENQKGLLLDYGRYAARFGEIHDWLKARQPPALMVWGRHDIFFDLPEVLSWMEDLPRMEAHVLDAGHFVLETHAEPAARLMGEFLARHA